jgi:DNA polymerase-3 subunit gamma/tau
MVVNCAGLEGASLSVGQRHRETLARQAAGLRLDTILAGLDILASTKARLRASNHGRTLLEMALVRLGRLDDLVSLSQLGQYLSQPGAAPSARPVAPVLPAAEGKARPVEPPEAPKKKPGLTPEPVPAAPEIALTAETLPRVWQEILAQVGPMLAGDLGKIADVAISGPNTLVLHFPTEYNLQRDHCQEPASVARIEEIIKKVTGRAWKIRVDSARGAQPGAAAVETPAGTGNGLSRTQRLRQEALQRPLVKKAVDVMGAQILGMDEGFGETTAPDPNGAEQTEE